MRLSFVVLFLGFFTVSCVSHVHPKMLSFTPASVLIDYTGSSLHEATAMAQQFCSSINKDAQYVSTQKEAGYLYGYSSEAAFFNCVESYGKIIQQQNHNQHYQPMPGTPYIINNK